MEKITKESGHKAVRFEAVFNGAVFTKENGRMLMYKYDDKQKSSQFIACCTKQDMLDAVEFLFAE